MRYAKRYRKGQLLKLLQAACPSALASFPDPSTFEFRVINRKTYLRIGRKTGYSRLCPAWVKMSGSCKPWLDVRSIDSGILSLGYCTFQGEGIFSAITGDAGGYAWSNEMKALVSFVFVYAGQAEMFADFDWGKGLPIFIEVLELIEVREKAKERGEDESESASVTSDENTQSVADEDTYDSESDEEIGTSSSEREEEDAGEPSESDTSAQKIAEAEKKRSLSPTGDDEVLTSKKPRFD